MRNLLDFIREPIMIGSLIVALLIVTSAYVGSHYYYGKVEIHDIPEPQPPSYIPTTPTANAELPTFATETNTGLEQTQLESDIEPPAELSVNEFIAQLSPEEKQLLTEEVADELPRESLFGLGPYPPIPPDYPRQNVWDDLEECDRCDVGHELIHRVLIKYWNQGKKTSAGTFSNQNGKVYPLFKETVYVKWSEVELEDGSTETYLGSYLCHGSLADYEEAVENGTQPSWLKVVLHEDGGVDPYSFLDLP